MVSWIRKDFITLDKLLREQHLMSEEIKKTLFNPQDVKLKIDRIILYIYDLDRCNEEVVIKVLEAIHLLLAFPLFVVVVGVDPRWLNHAINNQLGGLFSGNDSNPQTKAGDDPIKAATSFDYLEKIFQIPFAVKPITTSGREQLIEYLMKGELETIEHQPTETFMPPPGIEVPEAPSPSVVLQHKESLENLQPKPATERIKLSFKRDELDYIKRLSQLFGQTPRSINRYINIYRIVKSHKSLVIDDPNAPAEYFPVLLLLAIVVGCSEEASLFFKILKSANKDLTFAGFLHDFRDQINPDLKDFLVKHTKEMEKKIASIQLSEFTKNIDLIARFSFRTILK